MAARFEPTKLCLKNKKEHPTQDTLFVYGGNNRAKPCVASLSPLATQSIRFRYPPAGFVPKNVSQAHFLNGTHLLKVRAHKTMQKNKKEHPNRTLFFVYGGNNRARTCDPLLVRQMLSQLSYAPSKHKRYYSTSKNINQPLI